MKKLLLLTGMLLLPSMNVDANDSKTIELIDYDSEDGVAVYCIAGFAFVELIMKKDGNGGLTQIMRRHGKGTQAKMFPMTCAEYKKEMSKNK